MARTAKVIVISGLAVIALVLLAGRFQLVERLDAISSNPNPFIRHFSPTWRSLKKIADIPYIASAIFHKSTLPVYEITLSRNDLVNLIENLPDYPQENRLYEEFKDTVKAEFRHEDYYTADAEIRYRGVSPNHWNAVKKSLQVKLPEDNPLNGYKTYRFVIGDDKGWVKDRFLMRLAEKLGLLTPNTSKVKLIVNKKDMGVYSLLEGWEKTFLERNGKEIGPLFVNQNINVKGADLLLPSSDFQWEEKIYRKDIKEYKEFQRFLSIIAQTPDPVFRYAIGTVLDMDIFLKWTFGAILSGNFHQGNGANLVFYQNPSTGKMEPVYFDALLSELSYPINVDYHRIVNRVLKIDIYKKQLEEIAWDYLSNTKNLTDDLEYYDRETEKLLKDIYQDSMKIQTSYEAKKQIEREREIYKKNFLLLRSVLEEKGEFEFIFADETYPL